MADIANVNRRAVDYFDWKIVKGVDSVRARIQVHGVFELSDLRRSRRNDEILLGDRRRDVRWREALRLHRCGIDIHHDSPLLAAVRVGNGAAIDGDQAGANEVDTVIEQRLFAQPAPAQPELQDGYARGVKGEQERRRGPRRQLQQDGLGDRCHLRDGRFHVSAGLKEYLDNGAPVDGLRLDMLDIVHRDGERALVDRGDAFLHLLGVQPGIIERRGDHRDIDIGKDIGGGAKNNDGGQNQNQQR